MGVAELGTKGAGALYVVATGEADNQTDVFYAKLKP